ncbi:MAG: adenylate/guanylate cyclase domain-containing protein [Phyllobacterium sp.]|uniref:adenylate/guanylate cyclase domain-containing protein n=1 Tax=Phyllobacterium sp. TaxID=1871046 RepID=UPI0030F258E4
MSETRRKLTTIFSADVQDYTRLMQANEEGTLATLRQYRDAMARLIGSHGGRVINTWGDGLIAEFPSVVEAVRAAIDVQNELAGYNGARSPGERMLFRIGINLGDVIAEDDDIYGDGVNIAARLQATAKAGGIVISHTVYDQVRNKVAVGFEFLGALSVKNIEEGVPSYAVRIGASGDENTLTQSYPAFGREPTQAMPTAPTAASALPPLPRRRFGVLAVAAAMLVGINFLSWDGEFWARWPLLGIGALAALLWVRTAKAIDRATGTLAVIGLGIAGINLFSWSGTFWAVWPLFGLAVLAGLRWAMRRQGAARY